MMASVITGLVIYVVLAIGVIISVPAMPVLVFAVIIFILPVVFNTILSVWAVRMQGLKPETGFIFPLLSLGAFFVIALVLESSGKLEEYVAANGTCMGDSCIGLVDSILALEQIIFVGLLYFAIQGIVVIVLSRTAKHSDEAQQ